MKVIRRIIPLVFSLEAQLNLKNERRVEKFRQKLLTAEDFDNYYNYEDVQDMFEKDMQSFEQELEGLGLNIDFTNSGNNLVARSESQFSIPSSENLIKNNLSQHLKNQLLNEITPPPKNSTAFVHYATENLKNKISSEQKEKVEIIQEKINNHETVSKEDSLKLLMFEEIAIKFEDTFEKKSEIIGRSMTADLTIKDQGSALSQIGYYLDSIWNYGCWCYFGDNMSHGRGIPVNKVDQVCRSLNYCYTCVRMDESENFKSCAPGTVSYNRPTTLDTQKQSWEIACESNNDGDACKINTCKCETQFVKSLIQLFFDGYRFQPQFKHELGEFDPNSCGPLPPQIRGLDDDDDDKDNIIDAYGNGNNSWNRQSAKKPQGEKKCCGSYPDRKPYNSAFQGCCTRNSVGHVFNMEERMCCRDGSIKLVCPDYVDGPDD